MDQNTEDAIFLQFVFNSPRQKSGQKTIITFWYFLEFKGTDILNVKGMVFPYIFNLPDLNVDIIHEN